MAYVPIQAPHWQVLKCGPWGTFHTSTGREPKQRELKIPSMFWECAGFWFVVTGLYALAYMTWGV